MQKSLAPRPKAKLCNVTVGSPAMELVAMNIFGPLPETFAGNSCSSSWRLLYKVDGGGPIPNQDAITVAITS